MSCPSRRWRGLGAEAEKREAEAEEEEEAVVETAAREMGWRASICGGER